MPPPSPSPTSSQFPRNAFQRPQLHHNSASMYADHADFVGQHPADYHQTTSTIQQLNAMDEDKEEEEEDEDDDELDDGEDEDGDEDYRPGNKPKPKRTSTSASTRRQPPPPSPKKAANRPMSARYSAGTDVTLPPPRPHPGLAPAQPFDPYMPPSGHSHFISNMASVQSAPNTPLGHRPQFSAAEEYHQHPQTATLPPLSSLPGAGASFYPTLPPMSISPARPHASEGMQYMQPSVSPPSPPPSYAEYQQQQHHLAQMQYQSHPQHMQPPPAPVMMRHHSFNGPFYPAPQQPHLMQQQHHPMDQRQEELRSPGRRLSFPPHDPAVAAASSAQPHPRVMDGYHEEEGTFSPGSSMSSAQGPEPAYALHPGSPSATPPNGAPGPYLSSSQYQSAAAPVHYVPPGAMHEMHHHHHQQYSSHPRMVYMSDVQSMPEQH